MVTDTEALQSQVEFLKKTLRAIAVEYGHSLAHGEVCQCAGCVAARAVASCS